jgi:hypothetical protein
VIEQLLHFFIKALFAVFGFGLIRLIRIIPDPNLFIK